jgi:capsular exopolysaccharide synthesis family protein
MIQEPIDALEKQEIQSKTDGLYINPKRIISDLIRHWYVFIITIIASVAVAYLINRYTVKLYQVRGSILIKEAQEFQGPELLYNNPLVNEYRNYYNELYILRSFPVIEEVVRDLNLNIAFLKEGKVKDSELFNILPVKVEILNSEVPNCLFEFTIKNDSYFTLKTINPGLRIEGDKTEFRFGDTVTCNFVRFVITKNPGEKVETFAEENYLLRFVPSEAVTNQYLSSLRVRWVEQGSSVLELSMQGYTPAKEITFLEGLIHKFQQGDLERKNEAATRAISFIDAQLKIMTDSLNLIESQLQSFKSDNFMTNLSEEASRLMNELDGLQRLLSEIIMRSNYYEYLENYIQDNKNLDQVILPSLVGIREGVINNLVNRMIELQLDAKSMNREIKSENPLQGNLEQTIADVRLNILESLKILKKVDDESQNEIDQKISRIEKQLKLLPGTERALISIERNYSLIESNYIFLMQKKAEASISRASTVSDIIMINPPSMSGGAIKPQPMQNYTIALGVGFLLPILFFILKETIDNRIQSKEDIERFTDLPISGAIGHNKKKNNLVVHYHPRSIIAESFRSLRSTLSYFAVDKEKKIFLITSSIAAEGKTFTTVNLGLVYALAGKKTLLVGADLRKPRIYDDFGVTNEYGLTNYLTGSMKLNEIILKTGHESLFLVSSGPIPPNPSELIMRPAMKEFFDEATKEFDVIILDSPPLSIVTDSLILSRFCDHTLFIVRQNYTHYKAIHSFQELVNQGRLKSVSLVLNDMINYGPGYGYGYGYGYSYGYAYGYLGKTYQDEYYED